jgi:hypothetical protein
MNISKHKNTKTNTPPWIDSKKVLEWTFETPHKEGIISIAQMSDEATQIKHDWLLFYCWSYVRTSGFTTLGMKHWDYGNFGGQYKTSRDGVRDALSEFIKFDSTEQMNEGVAVCDLYEQISAYCQGIVWTEPKPLPEPPKPEPLPPPPPAPREPSPKPEDPATPDKPEKSVDWKKWLKILLPIIALGGTLGGLFLPGWAKAVLDTVLKVLNSLVGS